MATHRVEPGLARLFQLGIDSELPKKLTEWKDALDKGEITDEMVRVFHGVGWLSSLRDPRIVRDEPEAAKPSTTPWSEVKRPETPGRRHRIDAAKDRMANRERDAADEDLPRAASPG